MSQNCGEKVKNVCSVLLALVLYSFPYWLHYFTNEVKQHFYFDMRVVTIHVSALFLISLSQILFSGIADSYGFLTVFAASFVHCLIPLFIIGNATELYVLLLAHGWLCMVVAIFFPAASKLYGTIFTGLPKKVSFCFLAFTNNTAQVMGVILFFKIYFSYIDTHFLGCLSIPLLIMAAILIYFTVKSTQYDVDFQKHVSLKQVLKTRKVYNLGFSLLFLRFTRDFCFESLPLKIIRSSDMTGHFSNFLSAISGLIGSLFIMRFSGRPLDTLLQMQFICAVISLISSWLIVNDKMSGKFMIYLFGLFFDTPEAILGGLMAVETGEALGNAGARVAGAVNAIANFGRIFAILASYNMSKIHYYSCSILTISISLFFITLLLTKYCKPKEGLSK